MTIENEVIDGLFDSQMLTYVRKKYTNQMTYSWKANGYSEYDQGHWNTQVIHKPRFLNNVNLADTPTYNDLPEIQYMWNNLLGAFGQPRGLLRCYCNGYTFGTDGYIHIDERSDHQGVAYETVVVYLNEGKWEMDWAGEAIIYNSAEEPEFVCKPAHGRTLIFNSQKWHRALPVSRVYGGLRTIITFKTCDPNIKDERFYFIKEQTEGIPHSGRDFFTHSWNVAMILQEQLQASKTTCLAGLYHAGVYGTVFFDNIKERLSRDKVKEIIGEEAENIVCAYSLLGENRTQDLIQRNGEWTDREWGRLLQIEVANTIDQKGINGPVNQMMDLIAEIKTKDEL